MITRDIAKKDGTGGERFGRNKGNYAFYHIQYIHC